jgi:hypothetical protein
MSTRRQVKTNNSAVNTTTSATTAANVNPTSPSLVPSTASKPTTPRQNRKRTATASPLTDRTNLDTITENEETDESAPTEKSTEKRSRAAVWSRDEIEMLLKAVLEYAKTHGLPASTKPTTSNASEKNKIPTGWSTIASALQNRTPIQALRKFDNLKTDVCNVFEHI